MVAADDLTQPEFTGLMVDALLFAAVKHRDQRRKNPGATPYINHPLEVMHILWHEGGVRDTNVLIAAALHDTIEDTDTSGAELTARFGPFIAQVVIEVSDDFSLPKEVRKRHQIEQAPKLSQAAKLVKLGDKISNLRDILREAPKGWSHQRQVHYFEWARQVVAGLRGTNAALEHCFDQTFARIEEVGKGPQGDAAH